MSSWFNGKPRQIKNKFIGSGFHNLLSSVLPIILHATLSQIEKPLEKYRWLPEPIDSIQFRFAVFTLQNGFSGSLYIAK